MATTRTNAIVAVLVVAALAVAVVIGPFGGDETEPVDVALPETIEQLQEDGHTGSGVTVGVIDVTGIDESQPAVADNLVEARRFGDGNGLLRDRSDDHGTAASALVTSTAPDVELYFASADDELSFEEAVDWQLEQDVDIIVAPLSFYGKPGDGSSRVDRAARVAVASDVVFISPAGNLGQGHWNGQFLPATDGYHQFDGERRTELVGDSDRVELWLSGQEHTAELTLELYAGDDPEPIAESEPYDGDAFDNQFISTDVSGDEQLSVAVRGSSVATGERFRLTTPTHDLDVSNRTGSLVAPGTADGVLTVGSYDRETGIIEPYSGAGPTADGRPGIDILAPGTFAIGDEEFFGTSASAPYTAGVVSLLLEQQELSPAEITEILTETADSTPPYDDRERAGGGVVRPEQALLRAKHWDSFQ